MDDVKPQNDQDDNKDESTPITVHRSGSVIEPSPSAPADSEPVDTSSDNSGITASPESADASSAPEIPAGETSAPEPPLMPVESSAPAPEMAATPKDSVMPGLENESDTPPNDRPPETPEHMDAAVAVPSAAAAVKKKGGGTGLVIAVVIVIVLALSAVGYFAFMKSDDAPADTDSTSDTSLTEDTTSTETPDSASTAIDESLGEIDEAEDFNSTDIDDTTLGL